MLLVEVLKVLMMVVAVVVMVVVMIVVIVRRGGGRRELGTLVKGRVGGSSAPVSIWGRWTEICTRVG